MTQETSGKIDVTTAQDGGIIKEVLRPGSGDETPLKGDKVTVHYVGTLEVDGSQFDSSRSRGEPFEFDLGKGKVIKAWEEGIATMKKGELARFTCKPDYSYGETGSPPKIPPNSTLVFEVELLDWKGEDISEDKDGSIIRRILQKGEGWKTPNDGATVKVNYTGSHEGRVFEEKKDVEFLLGEGDAIGVVDGLEVALRKMKEKEKSQFKIASSAAYGSKGNEELGIPPNADLIYELELSKFEKAKDSWEMDSKEKLEQAEMAKSKGTNYFRGGNYKLASKFYKKICDFLEYETSLENEDKTQREALMLAAHLNLAMCSLKTGNDAEVKSQCDKALALDSKNEKAFFRRGQAHFNQNDYDLAKEDFEKVLEIDPVNKAAKNQIVKCEQKLKEYKKKEKNIYGGMFKKFAEQDAKNSPENVTSKETMSDESGNQQSDSVENGSAGDGAPKGSETSEKETAEAMETS